MSKEIFKTLFKNKDILIKKIISPRNFKSEVFIQNCDEWVMILEGGAVLKIYPIRNCEGSQRVSISNKVILKKDQSFFIPKKTPHQILSTSAKEKTVWLAVYFYGKV